MKISPLEAGLFHKEGGKEGRMDGQTDMTKLIVAFRNFANAPPKYWADTDATNMSSSLTYLTITMVRSYS